MTGGHILLKKSPPLTGTVEVNGAKNAVLVIMASLILTDGLSTLENVPNNADVRQMIKLLEELGATVNFAVASKVMKVDTADVCKFEIKPEIMNKFRASILVMGPLLARFGKAKIALPGGDLIGRRPINYHLEGFKKFGVVTERHDPYVNASLKSFHDLPLYARIILEYPSVGATENLMMFACLAKGETVIINAAIEPEVLDLIDTLKAMGADIQIQPAATIVIKGVGKLHPVTHKIIPDRLEVGSLLLAAAITGGQITVSNARADHLDIFLEKLCQMGHEVTSPLDKGSCAKPYGITLRATQHPQAVDIKTGPYPAFPTDLQPLTMAALSVAEGVSLVEETVYENRMIHTKELSKMGAQITVEGCKAIVRGVEALYGCEVIASDVRASCALVLGGLVAFGQTKMTGIGHWQRGYDKLEEKLVAMGADIITIDDQIIILDGLRTAQKLL